jgi:hypothetical protein
MIFFGFFYVEGLDKFVAGRPGSHLGSIVQVA